MRGLRLRPQGLAVRPPCAACSPPRRWPPSPDSPCSASSRRSPPRSSPRRSTCTTWPSPGSRRLLRLPRLDGRAGAHGAGRRAPGPAGAAASSSSPDSSWSAPRCCSPRCPCWSPGPCAVAWARELAFRGAVAAISAAARPSAGRRPCRVLRHRLPGHLLPVVGVGALTLGIGLRNAGLTFSGCVLALAWASASTWPAGSPHPGDVTPPVRTRTSSACAKTLVVPADHGARLAGWTQRRA